MYRQAVRDGTDIPFVCDDCKVGWPNVSFDVANVSFEAVGDDAREELDADEPDQVDTSLLDDDEDFEHDPVTFTVVAGGSSRGRDKLIDSHGFAYTVKRK